MIGFMAVGTVAIAFVSFNALRKFAVAMGLAPAAPAEDSSTLGLATSWWEISRQHGFVELAAFGVAMLLLAFVLRQVVLSGLRD